MKRLLAKYLDIGSNSCSDDTERQCLRLTNLLSLLVIILCVSGYLLAIVFFRVGSLGDKKSFLLAALLCSIFLVFVPVLSHFGKRFLARFLVILVCCIGCLSGFLVHGAHSNADIPLISAALVVFLLFSEREISALLATLALPTVTFAIVQIPIFYEGLSQQGAGDSLVYHAIASSAAFLGSLFVGWFYFRDLASAKTARNVAQAMVEAQKSKLIYSAKMAALGEMSSGIGHEINNPLMVIEGRISKIRQMVLHQQTDSARANELFDSVEKNVFRIAKIIEGLKTFSRDSSNTPFVRISVKSILSNVQDLCSERMAHLGISLTFTHHGSNLDVFCHPGEIVQIVVNLISNSAEALEKLPEKWIVIVAQESAAAISISVTDSGNGIKPDIVDKMFQPFFTTKDVGKGTGLGLSTSKGLAESNLGSLEYDATSKNTRFVLNLPQPAQPAPS